MIADLVLTALLAVCALTVGGMVAAVVLLAVIVTS